eukprot:GHVS01032680.1.p3 GENE.GHVS01032680.1~~GHVS01032680.1.p3  ORF type:complete len:112 (+),score=29.68 GHVS01032680.1:183-518(+)
MVTAAVVAVAAVVVAAVAGTTAIAAQAITREAAAEVCPESEEERETTIEAAAETAAGTDAMVSGLLTAVRDTSNVGSCYDGSRTYIWVCLVVALFLTTKALSMFVAFFFVH